MLPRELVRARVREGQVQPLLLRPTPATRGLCQELIALWQAHVGRSRQELEEQLALAASRARSAVVGRGLNAVLEEEATFSDPPSAAELRQRALAASAAAMAAPAATIEAHARAVAQALGIELAELQAQLYADLPAAAVLARAPALSVEALLARYNLALCQALLLGAQELTVTLPQGDTACLRRVLGAMRWRRLLALVRQEAGRLVLVVSGPARVLDGATRYGLQLAQFLPALTAEAGWSLRAQLAARGRAPAGVLVLDPSTGLTGVRQRQGYVPPEVAGLSLRLAEGLPGWRVVDPEPIGLADGELIVPDLALEAGARRHRIELFHRWHAAALARRLAQLARGEAPDLLLGVDRALLRLAEHRPLAEHPLLAARGFLFAEMPSPRAIRTLLERGATPWSEPALADAVPPPAAREAGPGAPAGP